MTREEAIELLENLKVCRQAHTLFNIEKEAVDMAIEALTENESLARTVNEASELLRKKRPHGEWVDESKDALKCSACGKWVYKPFIGGFPTERTQHYNPNYCAFCGADMREGEAE